MIQLDRVDFGYTSQRLIFEGFTWHVDRGQVWSVLGPSGCGKSTLLLLLAGLQFPQRGSITVDGAPLLRPRPRTGLILQEYGLLPWATVRENIALGLRIRSFYGPDGRHAPRGQHLSSTEIQAQVDSWLRRLHLEEIADRYPSEVSGGQRQRTAIARALVLHPDLLLMDEPFAALDAPTRETLQLLTLKLCREANVTIVLVTHSIEEATFVGQNVLLLHAPPNRHPTVIENTHAPESAFRLTETYQAACMRLRSALEGG